MFSEKHIFSYVFFTVLIISVCSAEAANSQPTSSSTTGEKLVNFNFFKVVEKKWLKVIINNFHSESKQSRSYTSSSSVDPNAYMNQLFAHKQPTDILHLVPVLLLLVLIPLVLPLIIQLFAGLFTPTIGFPPMSHGRRRRDTNPNFHLNPQFNDHMLDLLKKVGQSLDKYYWTTKFIIFYKAVLNWYEKLTFLDNTIFYSYMFKNVFKN